MTTLSRRNLLIASASAGLLNACGSPPSKTTKVAPTPTMSSSQTIKPQPTPPRTSTPNNHQLPQLRIFASSGFAENGAQVQTGLNRLAGAGFIVSNQQACYRRFQRFAGSDAERIADFQDVALGKVATPKVFMGLRGGYGAVRLLPHINWQNLGARMREQQTLLFGFSDVTAIQMALLAQAQFPSFAGAMLYSDFGKEVPDYYTMDSFMRHSTQTPMQITVAEPQAHAINHIGGTLWGGNLSVVASLIGSPYMPNINGGILFLEDVSEQPYRIERMLYSLHLAGILKKQQAIVLGNFRMGNIRDTYDSSYNLNSLIQHMNRLTGIPFLTGFPFGHIAQKATFPLGATAQIRGLGGFGGYQITFNGYPTLNAQQLNLNSLLSSTSSLFINPNNAESFE